MSSTISTKFTSKEGLQANATFDKKSLAGKSVLITGGTSGIGEAVLRAFVDAGAFVSVAGTRIEAAEKLVKEFGEDKVAAGQIDTRNWKDQLNFFKLAISKSPSKTLDIVIANAGISGHDDVVDGSLVESNGDPKEPNLNIVDINLKGVLYTVKLAHHFLAKQQNQDRLILITGSLASFIDQPGTPQYNASKFGVRGVMRSLRRTDPAQGIRINIIAPWYIRSSIMSKEVQEKISSKGVSFAEMSDAANAFLHVAADTSLNGRAVAIVPRVYNERGYMDVGRDDVDEDEMLGAWQAQAIKASARV